MKLISIELLREHVKSDGDDDAVLIVYGNAAESACARYANRNLYATSDELATAIAGVPGMMTAAYADYDADVVVANGQDDDRIKTMMLVQAQAKLNAASRKADMIIHGLAVDATIDLTAEDDDTNNASDVIAAVLLTAGHLYRNREDVITGQGAAAVKLPVGAELLMQPHRWIGSEFT